MLYSVIIMTLITIAVIRKLSVIYLHVRSEVGYQYGKNNMIRIIKDIFSPFPKGYIEASKVCYLYIIIVDNIIYYNA